MGASLKTELHKKVFLTWGSSGQEGVYFWFFPKGIGDALREKPLAGKPSIGKHLRDLDGFFCGANHRSLFIAAEPG